MSNVLFDRLLGRWREDSAPFLRSGSDVVTYRRFNERVAQFSHAIVSHGVKPGDRISVQVEKSPDALALYFATIAAGAIYSPLNTEYTIGELDYFIRDARPSLIVCTLAMAADVDRIADSIGATVATLESNGSGTLAAAAAEQAATFEPAPRSLGDLAAILYTSGTTGRSKGAMLTHANLLSNAETLTEAWRFSERDVLLHALPIFHAHGLFVATNTIALSRGSMIFHPRFILDDVIRDLPSATSFMGVPTFYTRLLTDPRLSTEVVRNMRLFVSGSAPLLAETHRTFEERTGHRILERYGMTETTMVTSNPYDGERRAGTVGHTLPGISVRICDSKTGGTLNPGEIGILEVAGPNVFRGYWGMPEKTESEFRDGGYFVTGDLARLDDDGYVTLVGREKDIIISGGYNIYPKEIEMLIDELDGVRESAVIGAPHHDFGEAAVAIVVLDSNKDISIKALAQAMKGRIARYKQPKMYFVRQELPRNAMGKVKKSLLKEEYMNCFV